VGIFLNCKCQPKRLVSRSDLLVPNLIPFISGSQKPSPSLELVIHLEALRRRTKARAKRPWECGGIPSRRARFSSQRSESPAKRSISGLLVGLKIFTNCLRLSLPSERNPPDPPGSPEPSSLSTTNSTTYNRFMVMMQKVGDFRPHFDRRFDYCTAALISVTHSLLKVLKIRQNYCIAKVLTQSG
jgi:hypothetical protein